MTAAVITLVLLGCMLLWIRAWQRGSWLASGAVIGAVLALAALPVFRAIDATGHVPVWLPALPFALIATALFAFGLLAWFWGDEPPPRLHESGRSDQPESMPVE
jgi:hypothetical protein